MVTSCSALRASPGQWINQPTRHSSIPMLDPFAVHHPHHSTNGMGVSRRSCSCSCRTLKSCRQQRHLECRLLVTPCHAWIVAMPCRSRVLSASCRSRVLSASILSRTTVALLTTLARARTSYIVAYLCLVAYPLSHCRTVALSHIHCHLAATYTSLWVLSADTVSFRSLFSGPTCWRYFCKVVSALWRSPLAS